MQMKKVVLTTLILVLLSSGFVRGEKDREIEFECSVLEEIVLEKLERDSGPITVTDALKVKELEQDFSRGNLKSLEGIQYFENLEKLTLSFRDFEDFSPLEELKNLKELNLETGKVTRDSNLKRLQQLEALRLWMVELKDYEFLESMEGLRSFRISQTPVSEGALESIMKLTDLRSLDLWEARLQEIPQGLSRLADLEELRLGGNQITEVEALAELQELKSLSLRNNPLDNLQGLESLQGLEHLDLSNTGLEDPEVLKELKNLRSLTLDNNEIREITGLRNLLKLERLRVRNNKIADISPLFNEEELIFGEMRGDEGIFFDGNRIGLSQRLKYQPMIERHLGVVAFDFGPQTSEERVKEQVTAKKFMEDETLSLTTKGGVRLIMDSEAMDAAIRSILGRQGQEEYETLTIEVHGVEEDSVKLASGKTLVSDIYSFSLYADEVRIHNFHGETVEMVFPYDSEKVKDPDNLTVHRYNEETQEWEEIPGEIREEDKMMGYADRWSIFAVMESEEGESFEEEENEEPIEAGAAKGNRDVKEPIPQTGDRGIQWSFIRGVRSLGAIGSLCFQSLFGKASRGQ